MVSTNAELVLVDRDIQPTLKRTWANLGFWSKLKVLGGLLEGVFSDEELSEEQLEQLKEKDHLSDMMAEFARVMPQVKEPLIDERDHFLMSALRCTRRQDCRCCGCGACAWNDCKSRTRG